VAGNLIWGLSPFEISLCGGSFVTTFLLHATVVIVMVLMVRVNKMVLLISLTD